MYASVFNSLVQHPYTYIVIVFVLLFIYIIYLHSKINSFTKGENGKSLEAIIKQCIEGIEEIEKRNELISKHALSLDTRVSHALRNAHMIRYKAFETGGSNQSFSIALLNEKGDGVVLTSLHARDRISTFAKPIEKYGSTYDLTDEEKEVIEGVKNSHKQNK